MMRAKSIYSYCTALALFFGAQITHAALSVTGSNGYASNNGDTNFALNLPASVAANDLLLVQINYRDPTVSVTTPTGWTKLREDIQTNDHQVLFYRFATSGDVGGAATSWSLSGSVRVAATIFGVRSDLSGRQAQLGTNSVDKNNGSTLTASSMNATAPGMLLRFYGVAAGTTTFTVPSSLTQIVTRASASKANGAAAVAVSRAIASASSTGSDAITASNADDWVVQSLLLTESQPAQPLTCYTDNFSSATAFNQNWVTTSVGTYSFTPTLSSGRLQLTDNNGYISTAATLQRLFPTSNLIYVEFNHYSYPSGSGADGIAVTLSDANITPQPGGFGGSLGYAQRSGVNGFAGGWMGVALDEYGNYSNATEGRNGGPGFRVDSVAIRGSGSGQSGYPYVAGTGTLSPGIDSSSTPGPGYRYRIIVDAAAPGQTYVTVDRDTTGAGTNYSNLIPTFNLAASSGQAAIPANLMVSFTGSTGGSKNIHEIGNLSICASTINSTAQVDHFEFNYATQGLTCEASSVQIKACADATCSSVMSTPVSVTLNSSGSFVGGNTQTFIGSTTLQLNQTSAGTATFSVASSSPGSKPFSSNKCNGSNSNSCSINFANAGLEFDVPDLLANKPSGPVRIRAVKSSGAPSNSCVPLFQNTTQSINFSSAYSNPNTGTKNVELRAGSGSGNFSTTSTALTLNFDNNGESVFEARYQDAGAMILNASYTGSGTYSGLSLTGTDIFTATPAGFCVHAPTAPSLTNAAACTSATCPLFARAGDAFTLMISAMAWESDTDSDFCTNNLITPNYSQNSLALGSSVVAPIATPNPINGVVTPATFNIASGSNASVTLNNVTESEVGVFEFVVAPPQGQYLGVAMPSGTNLSIGRFVPHHFAVSAGSSLVNRATDCAAPPTFTYIGETLTLNYDLTAQNANNIPTQNYQGAFANLVNFSQMNTTAIAPSPRAQLNVASAVSDPIASWTNGRSSVTSPIKVVYQLTPSLIVKGTSPVGPYSNTAFGVLPTDADGVTTTGISAAANTSSISALNLDTNVPADGNNDHVQIGASTELRYGRLRVDSVSGPVNMSLAVPITAEYWNGSAFVKNTLDTNCTTIDSNNIHPTAYRGNLNSGATTRSGSGAIVNGQTTAIAWSAPGINNEGSVDFYYDLINLPWLYFDWNGDGTLDTTSSATANFGTYRGSDRIIYWQEIK